MAWLPDHEDVAGIHNQLTAIFEHEEDPISPPGIKSSELLESACSRPHTGMGGVDKYESLEEKVAALFHSLTKNHAFHNGNKRTALVTALTVLYRNDRRLDNSVTDDNVYDFVVSVTADEYPEPEHGLNADSIVSEIAAWFKERSTPNNPRPSSMKTSDFLRRCEQAGASIKDAKGGSYVINKGQKSIRISRSTRQLDGMAILTYLRRLGLSESASGVSMDEFQDGYSDERSQIYRYMTALKRLAKT
ncbi:type II toxin-antitoxin system death-on-curing family toxin [Ectopseudomonas guguanensis]|uniref:Death-on-curing family protein n=1 Tax=Ectopseudomonas guguanensis TaxID=1198456 RepID=A0A1H0WLJ9_9GAMM|nr:type II toxin-antitoxin system death-on-curing family toxin [Pseudomonas guguanensis]SDP91498.1 death-on-curing family protein [Pseudomonas guguanensis]